MRLIPLSIPAAIAGLLLAADKILTIDIPETLLSEDGVAGVARVRFEVRNIKITLRQLDVTLSSLDKISRERKTLIQVRHLVALLGGGVLVLDDLASLMAHPEQLGILTVKTAVVGGLDLRDELNNMVAMVQDIRSSISLVLTILASDSDINVQESMEALESAITFLLSGDGQLQRRLAGSDALNASLATISTVATIAVPVCTKDLEHVSGYVFGMDDDSQTEVLRIISQSSDPGDLPLADMAVYSSCNTVFKLPTMTESLILQLFAHSIQVSGRFNGLTAQTSKPHAREKMKLLNGGQLRELCIDVYDEVVRRNLVDRKQCDELAGRLASVSVPPVELDGFAGKRNEARAKLAGLEDRRFFELLGDVCGELERRC